MSNCLHSASNSTDSNGSITKWWKGTGPVSKENCNLSKLKSGPTRLTKNLDLTDALDILDMMDAPTHRIIALPATTLAGLAVKARVARFSWEHFWDEPEENLDWDELMARELIDAVLDFCRSD